MYTVSAILPKAKRSFQSLNCMSAGMLDLVWYTEECLLVSSSGRLSSNRSRFCHGYDFGFIGMVESVARICLDVSHGQDR